MNWPTRLPVNRSEIAIPRSSGAEASDTQAIVNGWPIPSANPATKIIASIIKTFVVRINEPIAIVATKPLKIMIRLEPNLLLNSPKNNRENIDAPDRIAKIVPITMGDKLFSWPNNGKKITSTSTVDETAAEVKSADFNPGFLITSRALTL